MKKIFFLPVLIMMTAEIAAQNVGVGTSNPTEKLDVNGHLNITGNLKVNGVSGQSGQVLRTNSSGATEWSDLSDYKNHVTYTQNGTWIVPAGVTRILIEAWGGGGGGAAGGGGASGSYIQARNVPVTGGNAVNIITGNGGAPPLSANNDAESGANTTIELPAMPILFTAYGGGGAFNSGPGSATSVGQLGLPYQWHVTGNNGENTRETYHQYNSTDFVTVREYGNGGDAVMINGASGGRGCFSSFIHANQAGLKFTYSTMGRGYGAGGGGGASASSSYGANGGKGAVIIHF